jgi:hypothetical protein
MSGNDFQLDINNPNQPKIMCIQNNPKRSEIYSAPIGLYITQVMKVINEPGKRPLALMLDELPTIFLMGIRKIIDTGRSNRIATVIGIQGIAQMVADYGKNLSDVVFENCANIFCGSAKEDSARKISAIFGKTHQQKSAQTISKNDTTTNIRTQMMDLLPQSKIAGMSTGHFAGIVADDFEHPIQQKLCYGLLKPNLESKKIQGNYELPIVKDFRNENHEQIKQQKIDELVRLSFYEKLKYIDFNSTDYIGFYNQYLQDFSTGHYDNSEDASLFRSLFKFLKIYDHLHFIKNHCSENSVKKTELVDYINGLLDKMIINTSIEKVLNNTFTGIILDIDHLVKQEHLKIAKDPITDVFDSNLTNPDIEKGLDKVKQTKDEAESTGEKFEENLKKPIDNDEAQDILKTVPPKKKKNLFNEGAENRKDNKDSEGEEEMTNLSNDSTYKVDIM